MKKIVNFIIALVLFQHSLPMVMADSFVEVSAIGTIAGFSSLIKADSLSDQELEISVKKPDGARLIIPVITNAEGQAQFDLYAYHTKQAGRYEIAGKLKEEENFGPSKTFQVFPDEVSVNQSEVIVDTLMAEANGRSPVNLTIRLKDQYGNPIANHSLTVISSRAKDVINVTNMRQTDYRGEINYQITSTEPGVSIYSIFDTTAAKALEKRIKVIYHKPLTLRAMGGEANILLAQAIDSASAPGPVAILKIENLASTAKVNDSLNFKVGAYDKDNVLVTNYNGTVHFSTTDPNAIIPPDYTFTSQDLGQHTFSLALSFVTTGTQTFSVIDSKNAQITGSAQVTVETKGSPSDPNNNTNSNVVINKPTDGTYTTKTVTMEGTAPASTDLKIFDTSKEIGQTKADTTGKFTFAIKNISEGKHVLQVATIDKDGKATAKSKEVTVQIDSSAPGIDSVEISPSGSVKPGAEVQLKVYSEPGLAQIAAIFNDEIKELSADINNTGLYTVTLKAPDQAGKYPIDIIVVDELGNDISYREKAVVTVQGSSSQSGDGPSQVTELKATPGGSRITLNWKASEDETGIDHYRIYYGKNPFELFQKVDTFTNSTTWYVPNLKPETNYYFVLTAIDTDDNESKKRSEVVSASPLEGEEVTPPTATEPHNAADDEPPSDTNTKAASDHSAADDEQTNPESGPDVFWLLMGTLLFTNIYLRVKKQFKDKTSFEISNF